MLGLANASYDARQVDQRHVRAVFVAHLHLHYVASHLFLFFWLGGSGYYVFNIMWGLLGYVIFINMGGL